MMKPILLKNISWRHKELILDEYQFRFHGISKIVFDGWKHSKQLFSYFFDEMIEKNSLMKETYLQCKRSQLVWT